MISKTEESIDAIWAHIMEAKGDCAGLTAAQRTIYYRERCKSLELNELTLPFEYTRLNGKLVLYTKKDATDQIRRNNGISVRILEKRFEQGMWIVHVQAMDKTGRTDEDMGFARPDEKGGADALGNALLKATTKAKRRVTLGIGGLGDTDETELETIPGYPFSGTGEGHDGSGEPDPEDSGPRPDIDQIAGLCELARSGGDDLAAFGQHVRHVMELDDAQKVTRKFMAERMTMAQYQDLWTHYQARLTEKSEAVVVEDVDDVPACSGQEPSGDDEHPIVTDEDGTRTDALGDSRHNLHEGTATTSPSDDSLSAEEAPDGKNGRLATDRQMDLLRILAQEVGPDAVEDLQQTVEEHHGRLPWAVYQRKEAYLVKRRARVRTA